MNSLPDSPPHEILTPPEAARLLRISSTHLRTLTANGLPSISLKRAGTNRGSRRYRRADLENYLSAHCVTAAG